jgi:hypothetical protein
MEWRAMSTDELITKMRKIEELLVEAQQTFHYAQNYQALIEETLDLMLRVTQHMQVAITEPDPEAEDSEIGDTVGGHA